MQHALDLARPYWPLILAFLVWPIVGAALSWWLWWDTPAHWDAYAAAHPGRAFIVRVIRTVSPHLRKLVVAWREYAAARSSLPPVDVATLAAKQGALDVLSTRPTVDPADEDAHASIVPPAPSPSGAAHVAQLFAPHVRQPIAPEVLAALADEVAPRDGQRGSVDVRSLLAVVVALSVVLPLGVALCGCPRLPPTSGCQPEAQTCIGDRPHVCSASQRWHRAGDVQCSAVGGVCTVLGGRAYCAPVVDGGAADAPEGGAL